MRSWLGSVAAPIALLLTSVPLPGAPATGEVSFRAELQRLRSADHLYLPQPHVLVQYSGFSRAGSNPDCNDFLYQEGPWLVYTDCAGPGVVTRIWSTPRTEWCDIRVELDGAVIYEGKGGGFFGMNRVPFAPPLCETRQYVTTSRTAEGEQKGVKEWGVSYVPMPFQKRFRYMQTQRQYNNVNIKRLPGDAAVRPFATNLGAADQKAWMVTAAVWRRKDLQGDALAGYRKIAKRLKVMPGAAPPIPGGDGDPAELGLIAGPGIIRAVRLRPDRDKLDDVYLDIFWDAATEPAVHVPLDVGLGSGTQKTLALGRNPDGWRFLYLPMPFRKSSLVRLRSTAAPAEIELEVYYESVAALAPEAMQLRGFYNEGVFRKDRDAFAHPDVPRNEFLYHNGYRALDLKGRGHIVAYLDLFDCQPELDEHVFYDEERSFPENSWNGTGHEDLFDMAWGHKMQSSPMVSGGGQKMEEVNVKLFWNDPMTFRTAIRFNWEWAFRLGIKPPRDAAFRSVVYWYGP